VVRISNKPTCLKEKEMSSVNKKVFVVMLITIMLLTACAPAAAPAAPTAPAVENKPTEAPAVAQSGLGSEIRIGWVDSMTGQMANGGEMDWKGAQLAHKQRPTVKNVPVKLTLVDDKSDKTESATAAARLVDVEKSQFVIGSWSSSLALSASAVTTKAGIPFLTPTCTNPLITAGQPLNFRLNYIDPYQGAMLAKYAVQKLGAKKAAIIMDVQQDFSVGLTKFIRDAFIKETGDPKSVVAIVSFQSGDKDFTAQLTTVKNLNPDVVFLPYYYIEVGLTLKQAGDMDMKAPKPYFIGTTSADAPELISIAGSAGQGFVFSTSYEPSAFTSGMAIKFQQEFKTEYGMDPDYSAVSSYDSYNIVLDAIEQANTMDPSVLVPALANIKNWEGAGGKVIFDQNHDPQKSVIFVRLDNGKRVVDTVMDPGQ
jgi:branched-chain amino acid transport system substrate-binding protein